MSGIVCRASRDRLQLAHDPKYHELRSPVLEFLYSRQMRPKEAA